MNPNSSNTADRDGSQDDRPILLVPYLWVGDFVRCHTIVRLLKQQWPNRPIDVLTTALCAPLLDFMPGVRSGIVHHISRGRFLPKEHFELAAKIRAGGYGQVLVMPRTWKAALAPALARVPKRTGFIGEARFGLLNDVRWGEKALPRMIDRCVALAMPPGVPVPEFWPEPQLVVDPAEVVAWRARKGVGNGPAVVLAPGSVGPAKRWTYYGEAARLLADAGLDVWVLGGPGERELAEGIVAMGGPRVRDLTGTDLRDAVLALAAAPVAIANDSGLFHVAAAVGTPPIGIFGPNAPFHGVPLNPVAAVILSRTDVPCRPCHKPVCPLHHHACMRDISAEEVVAVARRVLAAIGPQAGTDMRLAT